MHRIELFVCGIALAALTTIGCAKSSATPTQVSASPEFRLANEPAGAVELLGVKEQETVVIQGVASRDKTGNVSIAAKGIFVRR
jgi:hypothetical protein